MGAAAHVVDMSEPLPPSGRDARQERQDRDVARIGAFFGSRGGLILIGVILVAVLVGGIATVVGV